MTLQTKRTRGLIPATILAIALHTGAVQAVTITNGSFETGDFSGWTTNGAKGSVSNGGTFFGGSSDGSYAVQMNDGNDAPDFVFEQTVLTQVGATYLLTFDYGRYDPDAGDNIWDARLGVEVIGNGTLLSEVATDSRQNLGGANDPLEPGEFLQFSAHFTANSAATILRFTDLSDGTINADLMADNFSLSVPDSGATIGLLGLALLGVGGVRKCGRRCA